MEKSVLFKTLLAASLVLPTMLVSCKKDDDNKASAKAKTIPVEGVSLSTHDTTLFKGEYFILNANILPDSASKKDVEWSSGDDNIATVTSAGKVIATEQGSTFIYVTTVDGEFKDSCKLSVINNIEIKDQNLLKLLVSNPDINKDGDDGISRAEALSVTTLDISGKEIESLEGLEYFINLEEFDCNTNKIREIDLSKNTKLKSLNCRANNIISINIESNTALTFLNCSANNIDSLNVMGCNDLETLVCGAQNEKNIKVSMTPSQYNKAWKECISIKSNSNVDVIMNIFDNVYFYVKSFSETIDIDSTYSSSVSDGSFFLGVYSKENNSDIKFFENSVLNQINWESSSEIALVSSEILGDEENGFYMQIKVTPKSMGETEISAIDGAGNKISFGLSLTR